MPDIKGQGWRQGDVVTLLQELKDCTTRYRQDVPLEKLYTQADGLPLSVASAPGYLINDNGRAVEWAATEVAAIGCLVKVPGEYDAGADTLTLRLQLLKEGSTDDITLGVAVHVLSEGTASRGADLNPTDPTTGAAAMVADTPQQFNVVLDSNSVLAGDSLSVILTPGAHGTDSLELWSMWLTGGADCETVTIEGED